MNVWLLPSYKMLPIVERDHVTKSRENILSYVVSSLSGFVDLRLAGKFIFYHYYLYYYLNYFLIIIIITSLSEFGC